MLCTRRSCCPAETGVEYGRFILVLMFMDQSTPPVSNQPPVVKRLVRLRTNRMIAGVCAGLGEYFGIDATIIRVIFLAMVFGGGFGVGLYIILWLVVPEAGAEQQPIEERMKTAGQEMASSAQSVTKTFRSANGQSSSRVLAGVVLIAVGAMALTNVWLPWHIFRWETIWPMIIVLVGIIIMFRRS